MPSRAFRSFSLLIIFRQRREVAHIQDASSPNTNNADALWRRSAPSPAKSTQPMPALGMIQWEGSAVDTRTSNEEILEATEPATWVGRARIDREHYDGPTSMERLQAHHDRMDKLARVHTRLPEQIMLDAALAAERLQHEGGDDVDGLPQTSQAKIVVCHPRARAPSRSQRVDEKGRSSTMRRAGDRPCASRRRVEVL